MKSLSRRQVLTGLLTIPCTLGAFRCWSQASTSRPRIPLPHTRGRRPNILLVLVDQERARHLLPAALDLPHHDRLMSDATVFRNASAVSNLCSMARGVIYTGLHPQHNGIWENTPLPYSEQLRGDIPTIGTMMQDAGYTTAYFGKWHLSHLDTGRRSVARSFSDAGFEISDQDREYDGTQNGWAHDPMFAAAASRFIHTQRTAQKPWFAAVNFVNPHDVMFFETSAAQTESRKTTFPDTLRPAPPDPLYEKDWKIPLPDNFGAATLKGKPTAQREMQGITSMLLGDIPLERRDLWRALNNYYFNCICDLDRSLGVVLDALEETGQHRDTIVIYMSDHGEMAGVHGLREKGGNVYREDQNIPLYIRHPDVSRGQHTDALASQLDLAPTLLGLAGVDADVWSNAYPSLRGHDLSTVLGNPGPGPRDAMLLQWTSLVHLSLENMQLFVDLLNERSWPGELGPQQLLSGLRSRGHMRGIVTGRYKFARYFSPLEHHIPATTTELIARNDLELYDTIADPTENTNLAVEPDDHIDIIEHLNARLNALVAAEVGTDDGSYLPGPDFMWGA